MEPTPINNDAFILPLAWPDAYVFTAGAFYDKLYRFFRVNNSGKYRVGHAALIMIRKEDGLIEYFDFGRYITPFGKGRVRGTLTDPDVSISLKAKIKHNQIENLEEIIAFLSNNNRLTHGEGRLLASVCQDVNYNLAKEYITNLQLQGSVLYGAFSRGYINCSRFVTESLIHGCTVPKIRRKLKYLVIGTQSPVDNVFNGRTDKFVYEAEHGKVKKIKGGRLKSLAIYYGGMLKRNYSKGKDIPRSSFIPKPEITPELPGEIHWLTGTGAGAWFTVEKADDNRLWVARYGEDGQNDYRNLFEYPTGFSLDEPYEVIYDTNAEWATFKQSDQIFKTHRCIDN